MRTMNNILETVTLYEKPAHSGFTRQDTVPAVVQWWRHSGSGKRLDEANREGILNHDKRPGTLGPRINTSPKRRFRATREQLV